MITQQRCCWPKGVVSGTVVGRQLDEQRADRRAEVGRLRSTQRATDDSLRRRIETLLDSMHTLREESSKLREQIGLLGE